nr:MAG TPA: hypothetical protein [Caudoviricetes sp.]
MQIYNIFTKKPNFFTTFFISNENLFKYNIFNF